MSTIAGVEILGAEAQTALAGAHPEQNTICAVMLLERTGPADAGALFGAIKRRIASALDLTPRLRKVAIRLPGRAPLHVLADAPEIDLDAHVFLAAADTEVSMERFGELLLTFTDQPMDPARPLWRVLVVPEIEGGRSGVVFRVHHFLQDGIIAAAAAGLLLIDGSPDQALREPPAYRPAPPPDLAQLADLAHEVQRAHRHEVQRLLEGAAGHPARTLSTLRRISATYHEELAGRPSELLARHSDRRGLELVQVPLADLRRGQGALGTHVSFNDVAVTALVGGLSAMLDPADCAGRTIRVEVPITLSLQDGGPDDFDQRASFMVLELPLDEPDPHALLRLANEQSSRRKTTDARALERLLHAFMLLPLGAFEKASAAAWATGDLLFSNIPGPLQDLYVAGHRVQTCFGVGNLRGASSLRVIALSFGDQVTFSILYDRESVPADRLHAGITRTLEALQSPEAGAETR